MKADLLDRRPRLIGMLAARIAAEIKDEVGRAGVAFGLQLRPRRADITETEHAPHHHFDLAASLGLELLAEVGEGGL